MNRHMPVRHDIFKLLYIHGWTSFQLVMIHVLNSHFKFCDYCRWMLVTRPRMSIGRCSSNGNIATFSLHIVRWWCAPGHQLGLFRSFSRESIFTASRFFFAVRAGQHKLWWGNCWGACQKTILPLPGFSPVGSFRHQEWPWRIRGTCRADVCSTFTWSAWLILTHVLGSKSHAPESEDQLGSCPHVVWAGVMLYKLQDEMPIAEIRSLKKRSQAWFWNTENQSLCRVAAFFWSPILRSCAKNRQDSPLKRPHAHTHI